MPAVEGTVKEVVQPTAPEVQPVTVVPVGLPVLTVIGVLLQLDNPDAVAMTEPEAVTGLGLIVRLILPEQVGGTPQAGPEQPDIGQSGGQDSGSPLSQVVFPQTVIPQFKVVTGCWLESLLPVLLMALIE